MEVAVAARPRRLGWEWAAILGGGVVGLVLLSLYLNDISDRPVRNIDWNIGLTLGFLSVACGGAAWHRRPDTPIGRRMVIAGFLVYAEVLLRSNNSWLFSLGNVVAGASAALLIHIVVTYPSGRCETVLERIVVVSGYTFVVVFPVARAATTDFGPTCFRCPVNRFYVGGYPNVFDVLDHVSAAVVVVIVAMMTAALAAKWRRSGRAARRVLAPSYASALLIVAVVLVARPDFDIRGTATAGTTAVDVAILTFPLALAFGLLRGHIARAAASDLLVDLGVDSDLGGAAARALDDPTARLYTWDAASSSFRDNDGARYATPSRTGRRLVVIERDGHRLAALDHDAALADEPERLSAVVSAVGLALDRARLAEEVQAQLAEVASSRSRIVVAADRERRRIERNLHDGAQQRLVGASMLLRRARTRALSDGGEDLAALLAQAADEIDRSLHEIRELARGLQPPLLEERGLLAALDSLVETTPLPTTVEGHLDHRPPTAVEAAAFFVASECLANAGKHAAATRVVITVDQVDGDLVLAVADNGAGGAVITDGAGLHGLRDRVEALDGTIDVCSAPQAGTTITVRLPSAPPR